MSGIMYRNKFLQDKSDHPEGTYFPDSDRRSIRYPAYYTVTCQHERKLDTVCVFTMYLSPFKVFFSREM